MARQQTFEFLEPVLEPAVELAAKPAAKPCHAPSTAEDFPHSAISTFQIPGCGPVDHCVDDPAALPSHSSFATEQPENPLARLRRQIGGLSTANESVSPAPVYSSGCGVMDDWLPRRGFRSDTITEWVADRDSSGAGMVSLISVVSRMNDPETRGPLVVVADDNHFYPPSASAIGIDVSRLIWVRPTTHADVVWSIDQALRCPEVACVWANVGGSLDDRDARRFQLASEAGGTPGVLVRPGSVRGRPTFAEVRMHVAALPTRSLSDSLSVRVTLDRCRGRSGGKSVDLRINESGKLQTIEREAISSPTTQPSTLDERPLQDPVCLAAELAHPKTSSSATKRRSAG